MNRTPESVFRAGFVKIGTSETRFNAQERIVHRAAAIAANETGATIGLHSPFSRPTEDVIETLLEEGFDLNRLVWAHAQLSTHEMHLKWAEQGVTLQFDAIGATRDEFFFGPTDDESMLDRMFNLINNNYTAMAICFKGQEESECQNIQKDTNIFWKRRTL